MVNAMEALLSPRVRRISVVKERQGVRGRVDLVAFGSQIVVSRDSVGALAIVVHSVEVFCHST